VLTGLIYSLFNNGNAGAAPVFAQYLKHSKDPKYSVPQINIYPTGTHAIQVIVTLMYAWSSDSFLKGRRWPPILLGGVCFTTVDIRTLNLANAKFS
jgi:ACS family pantothenate transporter-like MFS transporter